ncbi:MAG: hypothetical protein K2X03_04720 [Bryobacteraceae bacterium]|nr:hypothetical protein [Bryobacteraceae bacterium]
MAFAGCALAQSGRYDDRGYGRGYYERERYRRDPVRDTIESLYLIEARARVDRHEANHLRRAVIDLTEFNNRLQRGRFDRGRLNEAIEHLRNLAQADQLHPRDRRRIAGHLNDLYRLRDSRW